MSCPRLSLERTSRYLYTSLFPKRPLQFNCQPFRSFSGKMRLKEVSRLELPPTADMHVHLRDGPMMELITPQIRKGGVDTVFVMPNLVPPITTVKHALEYQNRLQAIEPNVNYLMSLYLHPSITPEVIVEAASAGIAGVKVYPQGVTTNSASGVANLDDFFPVFEAMEKHDLVLNIHGEVPDVNVMNAEEAFLPTLKRIHEHFPNLRIILEHCSTAAAVEAVRSCGPSVAATITAHHLYLTIDDTVNPLAFCKPIAKTPEDRNALLKATCSGDPKFFFGSDSAPHPTSSKQGATPAAGVYTQSFATQYVLKALEDAIETGIISESDVTQERLENFLSRYGRKFYKLPEADKSASRIVLERKGETIPKTIRNADGSVEVALSRGGERVFSLQWASQ
ncbi:dihydroorotase [Coccidioides posadasii str. Silveira]|uniref:dihydroorotase n=2 Tax=Coccidioides posadasii (strain RMSCC 757 / Silveira) TaxID=443226 RepID=E9DC89_COCPS|nr:dihydroorotase [Coccidioides posadasii str. Silveira]